MLKGSLKDHVCWDVYIYTCCRVSCEDVFVGSGTCTVPILFSIIHSVPKKERKRDVLQLWLPCYLKWSCFIAPVAVEQAKIYGQDEEARGVKRTAACPPALWLCTPPAVCHGCVWTECLIILWLCLIPVLQISIILHIRAPTVAFV